MRNPLVIGCGALANELVELTRRAGLPAMDLTCLPASLHNRPEQIPSRVLARIRRARAEGYERIFVAYADCGTGGLLDRMLEREPAAAGVTRLEGAHCYEVYAGRAAFAALHDAEPGTFYLTDYLVRNFDRLVVRGLGLDRYPELLPLYFGNYRRLVYLAQVDDRALTAQAEAAAARLGGLAFERRFAGLGGLAPALAAFAQADPAVPGLGPPGRLPSDAHSRRPRPRELATAAQDLAQTHDLSTGDVAIVHPMHERRTERVVAARHGAPRVRNVHWMQARPGVGTARPGVAVRTDA